MTGKSTRRERFLPYAYERSLVFEIDACTRDDGTNAEQDGRTIRLGDGWRTADVSFTSRLPMVTRTKLVPTPERDSPPLALLVALRCETTRVRRGQVFAFTDETAMGSMRLRRDELTGTAELMAWVVRTKPTARRHVGYALAAGLRVAQSPAWSLEVDRPAPSGAHGFEVLFKSFARDPAIAARERSNLYRLDSAQDMPVLWLNADHTEVAAMLGTEGTRGARARLRDVTFERIIAAVRVQLVLRAATHATADGPVYPWEARVLDDALGRLYPGVSAADRLARMRDDLREPAELVARLDDVIQADERTAEVLRKLLEDS
jgi:hypothetical protein